MAGERQGQQTPLPPQADRRIKRFGERALREGKRVLTAAVVAATIAAPGIGPSVDTVGANVGNRPNFADNAASSSPEPVDSVEQLKNQLQDKFPIKLRGELTEDGLSNLRDIMTNLPSHFFERKEGDPLYAITIEKTTEFDSNLRSNNELVLSADLSHAKRFLGDNIAYMSPYRAAPPAEERIIDGRKVMVQPWHEEVKDILGSKNWGADAQLLKKRAYDVYLSGEVDGETEYFLAFLIQSIDTQEYDGKQIIDPGGFIGFVSMLHTYGRQKSVGVLEKVFTQREVQDLYKFGKDKVYRGKEYNEKPLYQLTAP